MARATTAPRHGHPTAGSWRSRRIAAASRKSTGPRWTEGDRNASVAPDVFVVIGVPSHARPIYKVWEEGKAPDFVLEITSRHTRDKDEGPKRDLYERLGVQEYWQYDPTGDYLEPRLRGMALERGEYRLLTPNWTVDGTQVMLSAVLGLELRVAGSELRFRDPMNGERVRTLSESNEERRLAECRLAQ